MDEGRRASEDGPACDRQHAALGATFGMLAVALGAFGAHALKARLESSALETWDVAVRYQFWHALALLGVALLRGRARAPALRVAGIAFGAGTVVFSGSLYALALGAPAGVGVVTPVGGLLLLCGWGALLASLRPPTR